MRGQATAAEKHDLATLHEDGETVHLTPDGWQRACEIVRNHRLWELYLTNEARIARIMCTMMQRLSSTC